MNSISLNLNEKIFVIGLPRTGTTSICVALLNLGYKVAHTAYTQRCMDEAQAVADTPIFCDYQLLDNQYPEAKFIYLERSFELWKPSIRQLLQRIYTNIVRNDGGFNPTLKRCYQKVFSPFKLENFNKDDFLKSCYQQHKFEVRQYFENRPLKLLTINISHPQSYKKMIKFLALDNSNVADEHSFFEKINVGSKITAWNNIKHPLKVNSLIK